MAEIIQPEDFPVFGATKKPAAQPAEEIDNGLHPVVIDPNEEVVVPAQEEEIETPDTVEETEEENEERVDDKVEDFDPKAYLELASSLGVLELPEGYEFNAEDPETSVLEAIEHTRKLNYQKVEEALLNDIQDKGLAGLIKYGIEGGKFADLEAYFNTTKQEINYEQIDLDKEENQIQLYREYLNSTGRFTEKRINQMIEMLQEEDELSNEAHKARDYFIQEAKKQRENLSQEAANRAKEEERMIKERQKTFMSTLSTSGYSKPQQQKILNSFNTVELENGMQVRTFEKALLDIQNNPKHYIEFLSLLNEYNPEKGFTFSKVVKEKETEITKSVLDKFKEAAGHIGKGTRAAAKDKPIVPRDNPYVKNIVRY